MSEYQIYTDGGCALTKQNKPGRWAFVVVKNSKVILCRSGYKENTTNNVMELTAVIEALEWSKGKSVTIYTDSKYVKDGIEGWIYKWMDNNWKTSKGRKVKNINLWKQLFILKDNAKFEWVKGHSNNEFNKLADKLCKIN